MFAYCNNNPVNAIDPSGDHPYSYSLELYDYAFIHFMVQVECVIEYGWDMEIYVKSDAGRGYLDLLDVTTNEYYEVKSKRTYERGGHKAQMEKYHEAIIRDTKRNRLIPGLKIGSSVTEGYTSVNGHFQYGAHDVHYHIEGPGIIIYETNYNAKRAATHLALGVLGAIGAYVPSVVLKAFSVAIPLFA